MRFAITVDIDAPPERVWAVMSDIERWPEWTASVRSIRKLERGPLAVGMKARIRQPKLPPAVLEVTDVRPSRGFTWIARSPGVRVTAGHVLAPSDAGTRATLSVDFDGMLGPAIGWLTRGLNRRYRALEAAGLKRRSERDTAGPPPRTWETPR